MGSFSLLHWLIVLAVVIVIFGTKKLPTIGRDIGSALRSFREGAQADKASAAHEDATPHVTEGRTDKP